MIEFVRDPLWQFIGVILAIVAILVSVFVFIYQRRRKAISYEITSWTPIFSIQDLEEEKLQLTYEGQIVNDVYLIILRIVNSGNQPILPDDYEKPIEIKFQAGSRILSAETVETKPKDLQMSVDIEDNNYAVLRPVLFNSKEEVVTKMLVSSPAEEVKISYRIAGVGSIIKIRRYKRLREFIIAILAGFAGVLLNVVADKIDFVGEPLKILIFIIIFNVVIISLFMLVRKYYFRINDDKQ